MNSNNDVKDIQSNHSMDKSLKEYPLLSVDSNISVNDLYNILIKSPLLVNMIDVKGETFLSYALKRNNNSIIELILTSSPLLDLNYQDKKGNTYLHIAVIQQNIKVIKILLEKRISINTQNNDGNTALHFAYYIDNVEIIQILRDNNIDCKIKNKQGLIAENILPTGDIDIIAGYEVDMNFDVDVNEELDCYDLNEEKPEKYDLDINGINELGNEEKINKKNNMDSNETRDTQCISDEKKKRIINSKKKKIFNHKKINDEKDDKKIKDNIKKKNSNKSNINNNTSNITDDYSGLISLPFSTGLALRKLSGIDKVYNENDKFIRKESDNYTFYAELLKTNDGSNKKLRQSRKNNLSNILENNNISEGITFNDNNYLEKQKTINNSSLMNNDNNNNISLIKNNNSSILNNSNKNNLNINNSHNNNNITIIDNILLNCSNRDLLDFLIQINMQKYYNYLNNNNKLKNINEIIENAKNGKYVTDNELKNIGIDKIGDRVKILIRIKEKANLFEYTVPKSVYYKNNILEHIEEDVNIYKLYEWLYSIRLEQYINNFLNNGYFSIDLLFMQKLSNYPLNDDSIKNELGIDKLGHRTRIINKIREDCPNYLNLLKDKVVTFYSSESFKKCNGCVTC